MLTTANFFSPSENSDLIVTDFHSLENLSPGEIYKKMKINVNKGIAPRAGLIILFKTENNTFVLCHKNNQQAQISICIDGRISSNAMNTQLKKAIDNILGKKILPDTANGKDSATVQKSRKNAKKLLANIQGSKLENKICIRSKNGLASITGIISINCKYKTLNKLKECLDMTSGAGLNPASHIFIPLDSLVQHAHMQKQPQEKIKLAKVLFGHEIRDDSILRALDFNGAFIKWKNPCVVNDFQRDICLAIFIFLDDVRDIHSFLLTSKSFNLLLDTGSSLWKTLILPTISAESRKHLEAKQYKEIFIGRASIQFDSGKLKPLSVEYKGSALLWTKHLLNSYSKEYFLNLKKIDINKIRKFIREDDDVELFHEASRIGDLLPCILYNDSKNGLVQTGKIDTTLLARNEEQLIHGDFSFIPKLLPSILKAHAEKCFELFIRTHLFGPICFKYDSFPSPNRIEDIASIIFESSFQYFKLRYIQLTLEFGSQYATKKMILLCIDAQLEDLFLEAFKSQDTSSLIHILLNQDDFVLELDKKCPELIHELYSLDPDFDRKAIENGDKIFLMKTMDLKATEITKHLMQSDTSRQIAIVHEYQLQMQIFYHAVENSNPDLNLFLKNFNININEPTSKGESALILAARLNKLETVKTLMAVPLIDVNARASETGDTAFLWAAHHGNIEMLELFLADNQVNFAHFNANEESVISIAKRQGHADAVNLLLTHPWLKRLDDLNAKYDKLGNDYNESVRKLKNSFMSATSRQIEAFSDQVKKFLDQLVEVKKDLEHHLLTYEYENADSECEHNVKMKF